MNCLASCPYKVYIRNNKVIFEEQGGQIESIEEFVPDLNPLGCQKGSAWSCQLTSPDRILSPLRRIGERGSGKWEAISWDDALDEIANSILDAISEEGSESIIFEESVEGGLMSQAPFLRLAALLGAVTLDANGLVNDLPTGQHITFGKFACASTVDDTFKSGLLLLWHSNPAYTSIPYHHFISEAKYHGAQVVSIAPDYNASSIHGDYFIPIKPGTDAALALSMCHVIIEEGLVDTDFVSSQSDLPLLVVVETGRLLRGCDIASQDTDDQFYFWDSSLGMIKAPKETLALEGLAPILDGKWTVQLADNTVVDVTTVYSLLNSRLKEYSPENASSICGVNPKVIAQLARQVATTPTKILEGFNGPKYYHGDLMERSMCLLLALTGNWGKPGTGIQGLALAGLDGYLLFSMKSEKGVEETARILDGVEKAVADIRASDPSMTEEMAGSQLLHLAAGSGTSSPPVFFNYHHSGYKDSWNNADWSDPSMTRSFESYMSDATRRGWWGGVNRPSSSTSPRVFFCVGTNPLRRSRGGRKRLLADLWEELEKVIVVDFRMSTTAMHADLVLPAAMAYERVNVQYPITHMLRLTFSDASIEPPENSWSEWKIFSELACHISNLASKRGITQYTDGRRVTRHLDRLGEDFSVRGAFSNDTDVLDEWIRDSALIGTLPGSTTLSLLKDKGSVRFTGLGIFSPGLAVASDVSPNKVMTAFTWHTENHLPFPTLVRRAQFYIDHPWFLEADEHLPRHKEPPKMGGDKRFILTSGHSRWTVHSINMGNSALLGTHRGRPLVIMSSVDAKDLLLSDGEQVRVSNDHGSFTAMVRITSRIQPGQLVVYNGFEPHMFQDWEGSNEVEPGMVKWLHLVGKYGHLRYIPFGWQPVPADRAVFVSVDKAGEGQ